MGLWETIKSFFWTESDVEVAPRPRDRTRREGRTILYNIQLPEWQRYEVPPDKEKIVLAHTVLSEYFKSDDFQKKYLLVLNKIKNLAEAGAQCELEWMVKNPMISQFFRDNVTALDIDIDPGQAESEFRRFYGIDTFLGTDYFRFTLSDLKDKEQRLDDEIRNMDLELQSLSEDAKAAKEVERARTHNRLDKVKESLNFADHNCFAQGFQNLVNPPLECNAEGMIMPKYMPFDVTEQARFADRSIRRIKDLVSSDDDCAKRCKISVYAPLAEVCAEKKAYTAAAAFHAAAANVFFSFTVNETDYKFLDLPVVNRLYSDFRGLISDRAENKPKLIRSLYAVAAELLVEVGVIDNAIRAKNQVNDDGENKDESKPAECFEPEEKHIPKCGFNPIAAGFHHTLKGFVNIYNKFNFDANVECSLVNMLDALLYQEPKNRMI